MGYGFHPLGAWLANTAESLAMLLRPGNAGSVRHEVAQVEWIYREEVGWGRRCDPRPVSKACPRSDVRCW
jgi:hypothetical protein